MSIWSTPSVVNFDCILQKSAYKYLLTLQMLFIAFASRNLLPPADSTAAWKQQKSTARRLYSLL
jgi:hypothetical protein